MAMKCAMLIAAAGPEVRTKRLMVNPIDAEQGQS